MGRAEYAGWHFLPEEFEEAEIPFPEEDEPASRWKEDAIRNLAKSSAPRRLASMAEFMSRWHLARAEPVEASIVSRLAGDFERKFEQSALVRRLLERSLDLIEFVGEQEDETDPGSTFEDFE